MYCTVLYGIVSVVEQIGELRNRLGTAQYNTIQYSTIQYSTIQYSAVQFRTEQYIRAESRREYNKG